MRRSLQGAAPNFSMTHAELWVQSSRLDPILLQSSQHPPISSSLEPKVSSLRISQWDYVAISFLKRSRTYEQRNITCIYLLLYWLPGKILFRRHMPVAILFLSSKPNSLFMPCFVILEPVDISPLATSIMVVFVNRGHQRDALGWLRRTGPALPFVLFNFHVR